MFSFEAADNLTAQETGDLYRKFSNQRLPDLYAKFGFGRKRFPRAEGSWLYDDDGISYFDMTGGLGVANFGHNHPRIMEIRRQFSSRGYTEIHKSYLNRFLAAASYNLAMCLGHELKYSFFCNSGAEAIDGALKMAYKRHGGRRNIVLSSDRSFHGKTIGAGSISAGDNFVAGDARFRFQSISGVKNYKFNCIDSLEQIIGSAPTDIYAIFVEPFSCSTLTETSQSFLRRARELCDAHQITLVFDEIYSGFGKCGHDFYFHKAAVRPDIVCLSKALGGGKASISAYVSTAELYDVAYGSLAGALLHSTTYNSFGEECATALESCRILTDSAVSERSAVLGDLIRGKLNDYRSRFDLIADVKGAGSHNGIVLSPSKFDWLGKLLKYAPSAFMRDPLFLNKLVTTAVIDQYFACANVICAFTSNREVILNFSPAPLSDPADVCFALEKFEEVLSGGISGNVIDFISRTLSAKRL